MLASSVPVNFPLPFANAAGVSYIRNVPTASQIGITPGAASLTDGFPPLCFSPQISGGIPPSGADINGLLKQVTQNIQWWGAGGYPQYNSTFSTAIGGYPNGAILQSADYAGYWLSSVDSNTSNPDTNGANWLPVGFHGSAAITMTTANVTLTLAQYSRPIIVITGALTGGWNLIFPNIIGEWLVINNTTGAFTITAKTAAGTGYIVPQGAISKIYGDGTNISNSAMSQSSADLRYAALNGNAAQVFSAATATIAAQVTRFDQVFGVGQTRQDLTGSRMIGTLYTNSTSKPIRVSIVINIASNGYVYLNVGGIPESGFQQGTTGAMLQVTLNSVVMPGETYQVVQAIGTSSISAWSELR